MKGGEDRMKKRQQIKISGVDALALTIMGYKVKRCKRYFTVSTRTLLKALAGK